MFSVHRTDEGSQSIFFRATLRLSTCVRHRWVFDRSQRILATELPTVPKPSSATLQVGAPSTARPPVALRFEVSVIPSPCWRTPVFFNYELKKITTRDTKSHEG